ncbi:MAG: SAM-dependent methyltransferase [Candidatus Bathyarchaeia archaeon]
MLLVKHKLMQSGLPSRTALAAAAHRAAHQILEGGCIFADPLALRILGEDAKSVVREATEHPSKYRMRIFIAMRTRFAEDALAAAVEHGVRQLVVLGAGLDTYAYRNPSGGRLRIFEVDHPATQVWKRQLLAEAAIKLPDSLVFVPVDFERESLSEGLRAAGFDPKQQTFFTWLGVVPYLTEPAIWSTLGFIASLPNGAHVVFDYSNPPASFSPKMRIVHEGRAAQVAKLGETFITYFETEKLRGQLTDIGFVVIEDEGPPQMFLRFFPDFASSIPEKGGHILHAATILKSK